MREAGIKAAGRRYLVVEDLFGEPLLSPVSSGLRADPRLESVRGEPGNLDKPRVDPETILELRLVAWPRANEKDLPVFGDPEEQPRIAVFYHHLQAQLDQIRKLPGRFGSADPELVRKRPIRVGDVFAAKVSDRRFRAAEEAESLVPPIWLTEAYDITADAREAIRQLYFDALSPELSQDAEDEIREQFK